MSNTAKQPGDLHEIRYDPTTFVSNFAVFICNENVIFCDINVGKYSGFQSFKDCCQDHVLIRVDSEDNDDKQVSDQQRSAEKTCL